MQLAPDVAHVTHQQRARFRGVSQVLLRIPHQASVQPFGFAFYCAMDKIGSFQAFRADITAIPWT